MDDFLHLTGRLKRVASTNGGEYCGPCPFCGGRDRFRLWPNHPSGKLRWWCRQCGRYGDAIDLLRELKGLTYAEALERLGVACPATPPAPAPLTPSPDWQERAARVVADCEPLLWSPTWAWALAWLRRRGLSDDTLRAWRIGYNPRDCRRHGLYVPRGIVIPCFVDGAVQYVKVRLTVPSTAKNKYRHVGGGNTALFGLDRLTGKRAVVICEAELDAILLHQEAGDLVDVVALGSKSAHPALPWLVRLARAAHWLVALDADAEEKAAWWCEFSARARRMRPLQGNDITEFFQAGGNLRAWVEYHLQGLASPDGADLLVLRAVRELGAVVAREG